MRRTLDERIKTKTTLVLVLALELVIVAGVFHILWGVREPFAFVGFFIIAAVLAVATHVIWKSIPHRPWAVVGASTVCLVVVFGVVDMGIGPVHSGCGATATVPTADFYVMTIQRSAYRLPAFEAQMVHAGVEATALTGVDANDFTTTHQLMQSQGVDTDAEIPNEYIGNVALVLGNRRVYLVAAAQSQADWLVIFEDDVVLLANFVSRLSSAICFYGEVDMIWLDTRNAFSWMIAERLDGELAGAAIRRRSVDKIASLLDINSPEFQLGLKTFNPYAENDVFLAQVCFVLFRPSNTVLTGARCATADC